MYLDQIIGYINEHLRTRLGAKASNARFYGVCKHVAKEDEIQLVCYDNAGNDDVVMDNTFSLITYHRFTGWTLQGNEQSTKMGFGDSVGTKTAAANFILGVFGDRKRLGMTDQELTASIVFSFPDVIPKSLRNQLTGLQQGVISPLSTNNSTADQQENISVNKEDIFFTVNYRVNLIASIECLAQCNPSCA